MWRLVVALGLVIGLGGGLEGATAPTTTVVGKTRQEVMELYGPPVSRIVMGKKEVLNYPKGKVTLDDGKVVESDVPLTQQTRSALQVEKEKLQAPVAKQPVPAKPAPIQQVSLTVGGILMRVLAVTGLIAFALVGVAIYVARSKRPQKVVKAGVTMPPMPMRMAPAGMGETRRRLLTNEDLFDLEWRRFEELVEGYFRADGLLPQRVSVGPDGGVDLYLYRTGSGVPIAYVQCKSYFARKVDVKLVREFFGVMASDKVDEGFFVTTAEFTADALAFAEGKKLHLIDGAAFLGKFNALEDEKRLAIIAHVFRGDYATPTCPKCDIKMVMREAEKPFWGCTRFPKCYAKLEVRKAVG